MKKEKLALLLGLVFVFATGCTKNYKTVDEYSSAMKTIKNSNSSYTIEAKQYVSPNIEFYYKSYVKGDKWKTETSMNGGSSYMRTILYDGEDVVTYSQGMPDAVIVPVASIEGDPEINKEIINSQNPVYPLLDWKEGHNMFMDIETGTPVFLNNKDNKNGFDCRLIKFSEAREACVSDKYGIAVYQKMIVDDLRHPGQKQETTINLVKVDTTNIPDSTFELPNGVKKIDMQSMFDNLSKMMGH